ncbi:hypothetical protein HDU96_005450 [Phlyctochytrium bullatum]|nr:hypothetical protein HDU96_005450 [Phlyctochytrium bullatum]
MFPLVLVLLGLRAFVAAAASAADAPTDFQPLTTSVEGEKYAFQAENSRILNIVINSLYKSKEIFLRELISNAADALDKLRFKSLTNPSVLESNNRLDIRIYADKERQTLTVTDTGVGMTAEELKKNLGTIAKSGTSDFISALERNTSDLSLIGQFGVGFYSVFLVCDRVTVASKSNDDPVQHVWESSSQNDFSIGKDPRGNSLGRGTEITMHIKTLLTVKPDATKYLEPDVLEKLVSKYSEFINFPIYLWKNKTVEITDEDTEDAEVEDVSDDVPKKPTTKEITTWVLLNENKPIWSRSPSEITADEYKSFYKAFAKDRTDPMSWIHFRAEGETDFRSILYIPAKGTSSFLQKSEETNRNIKLYVRKVFITDELEDFFPRWLAFIKGLVDSDDFPLNVSRETLQKHALLKLIKKKLIAKSIEMISQLSNDAEQYKTFFTEYGLAVKLGVIEDTKNRKKLLKLVRFASSEQEFTSLDDYLARMKAKQSQILFLTGSSLEEIKSSPLLEIPVAKGLEVLYLADPLDEYLVQQVSEYKGFKLQSLGKPGVVYGDEEKTKSDLEKFQKDYEDLIDWLQKALEDVVEKVVISTRLTKSPTAILANEFGVSGNMERIMAAQALQSGDNFMRDYYSKLKKTLEINPYHPLIKGLKDKVAQGESDTLKEQARVLYEVTLLRSGFDVKSTVEFAGRVEKILRTSLGVSTSQTAEVNVAKAEEKPQEEAPAKEKDDDAEDDVDEVFAHDEL